LLAGGGTDLEMKKVFPRGMDGLKRIPASPIDFVVIMYGLKPVPFQASTIRCAQQWAQLDAKQDRFTDCEEVATSF